MQMDSRFQSSFIPRAPVSGPALAKSGRSGFNVLATIVFVLVLLATGGVFFYKMTINKAIASLTEEIAVAEAAADKAKIDELANFDKRLKSIDSILSQHVAVSEYLKLLSDNTLKNLSFSEFQFSTAGKNLPIKASFKGTAPSYAAIAQEESILLANPHALSLRFANFSLAKNGAVNFSLEAEFKNDLLNWSKTLEPEVDTSATVPAEVEVNQEVTI